MDDTTIKPAPETDGIMEALSALYYAIYLLDIEHDSFSAVRESETAASVIGDCRSFTEACRRYIDANVCPEDAENVRRFASTEYLGSILTPESPSCRVELRRGKAPKYEWIAINLIATAFSGGKSSRAVVAVENIDGLKSSMFFKEQFRMQAYARKIAADAERRVRSITERTVDERSSMLLKMNSRSRLLYLALQRSSTQAFEYDVASDKLSVLTEWYDTGELTVYTGGADCIAEYCKCSERDTLALENAFNKACAGRDAETEFAVNKGEERTWKRLNLYVMRVDSTPTGTVVGVISDITREREMSRQAREEEEFRKTMLGSSAYGLEVDLEHNSWRYLWKNDDRAHPAADKDNYDRALLSSAFPELVYRDDLGAFCAAMDRNSLLDAFRSGENEKTVDYRVKNDDGEPIWFRNVIHILEDDETGTVKASVYVTDINSRKKKELSEAEAKRGLEERARAEIRANELKSEFLTNMSHELRTPLNAMLGMSQLALREEMSAEARSYIHAVRTAGTGLLGVVNGILDLARIETGKLEISSTLYSPLALMDGIASMFSFQANDKALNFVIEVDPNLPSSLVGDESNIRQVLINLINNALKFTESGSVTVSLGGKPADGGIILTACVRDTGVGIKAERLPGIFDQFREGAGDEESGTGLGLSISSRLVRLMGGEMTAESEYGVGSCFSFEIPQKVGDSTPGGEFVHSGRSRAEDGAFWNFLAPDATVMMVDDNSVNLRVGIGLLRPFGMRVITASGGAEALNILHREKVDLVLMDHMMPEMDGVETAKRIRAMGGEFEKLPILALTANAMKGVKEMLLANGMDDYMSKPVEMWELSEKLRRWLPEGKVIPQTNTEVPVTREWPVNLPDIPGVDVADGLSYMCTFDDYMTCLRDFWSIIPEKAEKLDKLAAEDNIGEYTSEIHSLKSSSRLIGADALSDMAARLERFGHEGRGEDIRRENEKLLTLYKSYSSKLEPYARTRDDGRAVTAVTEKEFVEKLCELEKYVRDFDCDSADHWSDRMRYVSVPEKYADGLEQLHMYILAAKFTACAQLIEKMKNENE